MLQFGMCLGKCYAAAIALFQIFRFFKQGNVEKVNFLLCTLRWTPFVAFSFILDSFLSPGLLRLRRTISASFWDKRSSRKAGACSISCLYLRALFCCPPNLCPLLLTLLQTFSLLFIVVLHRQHLLWLSRLETCTDDQLSSTLRVQLQPDLWTVHLVVWMIGRCVHWSIHHLNQSFNELCFSKKVNISEHAASNAKETQSCQQQVWYI